MAVDTTTAPGATQAPGAGGSWPARWRTLRRWAGLVPFSVYMFLGLGLPAIAVAIGAFQNSSTGGFTLDNVKAASHGIYLQGFETSLEVSVVTAIVPGIVGFLVAYAIFTAKRGNLLRRVVMTASGVFANFGGVPLAFLFIASLSATGAVTGVPSGIHFLDPSELYTVRCIFLAYLYFQTPLMVLIILPALEGLRPAWREAAQNMGAGTWQYWRYVGGPVLFPSFLGCLLLLFGGSFSAYATAEALTGGTVALTSIQIGALLNGNVIAGQENLGYALGLIMIVIIAVVMILYTVLQR